MTDNDEPSLSGSNWALAVAKIMDESEDIDWVDDPEASVLSREYYEQYVYEKWLRTQNLNNGGHSAAPQS